MTAGAAQRARLERIADHGVVGAGGAGFPTHVKLANAADTLLLNAAECEPLLHKDKEILRHFSGEVIAGLRLAGELVGARDLVIGIKGKYTDVIAAVSPQLPANARIVPLSDSYPSGDELILVHDCTGRIVPPGRLPLTVGCCVLNVETACNIGRDAPVTEKFLTVAGAVAHPVTLRVPLGTPLGEILQAAGGATVANPRLLTGGVMMGALAAAEDPLTKTCGGLIVLPADHGVIRRYEAPWRSIAAIGASACDQCSFCTELCPRYLLGHPIEPHRAMRSLGFVVDRDAQVAGTQFCCECNLCTMLACPEDLDPRSVCAHGKRQLAASGVRWQPEPHPHRAELHLDNRRAPISRLMTRLGLHGFTNEGPLVDYPGRPRTVCLPLKQHAGAAAVPCVAAGTRVRRGAPIARPAEGALGAALHASIDGTCRLFEDRMTIVAAGK